MQRPARKEKSCKRIDQEITTKIRCFSLANQEQSPTDVPFAMPIPSPGIVEARDQNNKDWANRVVGLRAAERGCHDGSACKNMPRQGIFLGIPKYRLRIRSLWSMSKPEHLRQIRDARPALRMLSNMILIHSYQISTIRRRWMATWTSEKRGLAPC